MDQFAAALELEIVGRYEDREKSGKTTIGREGLEAALSHVCRVRGVLVIFSLSRLSRNMGDAQRILERLTKRKASLASVSEVISTTTAFGRAMFGMNAVWCQLEREQTIERTVTAMHHHQYGPSARRMGRPDRCPFGFTAGPNGILEPEPTEQATIARIKELSATGMGHREITRQLDVEGIDRRGKSWKNGHGLIAAILHRA